MGAPIGITRAIGDLSRSPRSVRIVGVMVERMGNGDFYIICPDNDVTTDVDNRRILWGAEDIIHNRPPLSRWHPDHKEAFAKFAKAGGLADVNLMRCDPDRRQLRDETIVDWICAATIARN